jgi:glycosyltransferase involved in cell wall biosynthesis
VRGLFERETSFAFRSELPTPSVSVVMPVRDEGDRIGHALASVLQQDYPADRVEVIVVVGGDDRTREVAAKIAAGTGRVSIIENEDGRTPVALNLGIDAAGGAIIARVDGHGLIEPDYLSAGIEALARTRAAAVGGVVSFVGVGPVGRAIALAMGSRLGAGTAAFRHASREVDADGLSWGIFPREVFERVGPFDERLTRNQDDELCHRIRLAGGRLVVTPAMRYRHYARKSLKALWQQYWQWGAFRVMTLRKHRRPATLRQMVPPTLVCVLAAGAVAEVVTGKTWGRVVTGSYAATVLMSGIVVAARARELALGPLVVASIGTMHMAYGCGFWTQAARELAGITTS